MTKVRQTLPDNKFPLEKYCSSYLIALLTVIIVFLAPAGAADYRKQGDAPATWQQFSLLLKSRLEEWVAADTETGRRFRDWGKTNKGKPGGPPDSVIVRVWANADGSISRVEFPSLPNAQANDDFRALLLSGKLTETPPADMLQPVNLRIILAFTK
jgi:hypothetical protein